MMGGSSRGQARGFGFWVSRVFLAVVCFLAIFYIVSCIRIVQQSEHDEARPADAIIVFGAAEYDGRPSPVFRARLDHAYTLFEKKLAPIVIVSGGAGGDPKFSEGGVGRDYLNARGIPDRHLIAETQGDSTSETAERVGVIMRANGWKTCIAVSDPYHVFRTKRMLQNEGLVAYVSPRPQETPLSDTAKALTVMREALSLTLWKMHIT
ncbi:MAG TPA: YdcF family protein [Terriglobales bacterium]|nr:YdcF family protein [Terriglobales bacterium]